ncbi:hypothetical protein [Actinomadura geliboluensis]|uniref:hypothetical protein n=1 Tax=Actinomadura geliboluensis TaxID=882440 RepID=UPI0036774E92
MGQTAKGQPNGLATLDENGHVPPAQLGGAGGLSQGAAVADVGALTSVVAAGATPTKAEYDALRVDVSSNRTKINALLASLRAAGLIDT